MRKVWHNIDIRVQTITNDFLGEHITVAGLLTAQDVIAQVNAHGTILLPQSMFNHDGVTLDDYTVEDIARELDMPVRMVACDAQSLIDALTKGTTP
jgi:NifB/MoaA-like Fe-S oxidoreductase